MYVLHSLAGSLRRRHIATANQEEPQMLLVRYQIGLVPEIAHVSFEI